MWSVFISALKLVGRWSLKEGNPRLHHCFGDRETCWRRLRISCRKSVHQLIWWHIKKVYFATGPRLLRSRSIVLPFLARPKTEIEDDIHSQFKRSPGYVPKHHLNETVPGVMIQFLSILTKQMYVPFIRCQSKGKLFTLKSFCTCRFSRTGKSNHQMKRCHSDFSQFLE